MAYLQCAQCDHLLSDVDDEHVGRKARCPMCQNVSVVTAEPTRRLVKRGGAGTVIEQPAEQGAEQVDGPPALPGAPQEGGGAQTPAVLPNGEHLREIVSTSLAMGAVGAGVLGGLGLAFSQYWPLFGGLLEKALAQPWSPARLSLIPIHVIAGGLLGAMGGVLLGIVRGITREVTPQRTD